jgi:DNA repair exonuclease SbcCD ATPase subunit
MIKTLALDAWRAFEHLELAFEPGTTFVTARNSVGKTSVVQGIEWALFGDLSSVDAGAAIRKGAASASAHIELVLPDDRTAAIRRTIGARRSSFAATVDGEPTSEEEVRSILSAAYGARTDDLARLTVVPAGLLLDYGKEQFHLRRHLYRLFGIDGLEAAGPVVERVRRRVAAELRKVRDIRTASAAELDALAQEVEAAEAAASAAREGADAASRRLEELRRARQLSLAAAEHTNRVAARAAQLEIHAARLADLLRRAVGPETVEAMLVEAQADADARAEQLIHRRAEIDGRLAAASAARDQLHRAGADCPICRRPLGPDDIAAAEATHEYEVALLRAEREQLTVELDAVQARRRDLADLDRALRALPDPGPPPPPAPGDPAVLAGEAQAAEETYRMAAEAVGHATATASMLKSRLAEERTRLAEQQAAVSLHAQEAVLTATADAFQTVSSRVIEQQIDPLAREVARRWKMVFGGRRAGLTLDTEGRLFLERGGHEIGFSDMSAGERAVALITTRLLVLSATTRDAFVCFDEPLEQLDPLNRRVVALALAQASGSGVRQVIATTFEDGLARRLAGAMPNVHVLTVTIDDADPDGVPTPERQPDGR